MKYIKGVNMVLVAWIVSACFISCCHQRRFVTDSCVHVSAETSSIGKMDSEFMTLSPSKHYELWRYLETDIPLSLDADQVKINYRGKAIKSKLLKFGDEYWDYKNQKHINLVGKSLYRIRFKCPKKLREGEKLVIVEKDFPVPGDSIVTSIDIPDFSTNYNQSMNNKSGLYMYYYQKVVEYFISKGDSLGDQSDQSDGSSDHF